jgi:lon-related putative ATP-dependent protease
MPVVARADSIDVVAPELHPNRLRRSLDPARLGFKTTADLPPLKGTVGQPRALEAITFGLNVPVVGHHLFVAGTAGSGRTSTILDFLATEARRRPSPDDWVYVHNFAQPERPKAIRLPAGRGRALQRDMEEFVPAARAAVGRAFEGESYAERERELNTEISRRREALVQDLKAFAAARSHALEVTPVGVMTAAIVDGKPLTPDLLTTLEPLQRALLERAEHEIAERTTTFARELHLLMKEASARHQALEREVASFALGPLFHDLEDRYADIPDVLPHLESVRADVLEHLTEFRSEEAPAPLVAQLQRDGAARYAVNVVIDNTLAKGAPVVVETNTEYRNLIGRVSYRPTLGAMVTDFREVQAGALHRANGGFLVLEALDLLRHPFAWDALKRALRTGEVAIENPAEEYTSVPTSTLRPEPIPIDVKVILVGSRRIYQLLYQLDEDFRELFRVKADFAPRMEWNARNHRAYAAFVSRWVRENKLLHFDATAVARLIEHGARLSGSQRKLSTRLIEIADVATEASFVAARDDRRAVCRSDVSAAIRRRHYRSNLVEEQLQEMIDDGTLVIDTSGSRIGSINGLSVYALGDYAFGRPCRVSARVSLGRGSIASVERETELSGPIHSKGFLVVSGYLAATYALDYPLALSATLTFEQAYDEIEGDSASSTELYVLLSALAGLPLRQDIAVTGSVDQHGRVQAVGGVNEKIEGFYATCLARGLTTTQGVLIPAANASHLMLDEEIVDAARAGRFHVWTARTIDEGLTLLTGRRAGRRRANGSFPPDTVHGLVDGRLRSLADAAQSFGLGSAERSTARARRAPTAAP